MTDIVVLSFSSSGLTALQNYLMVVVSALRGRYQTTSISIEKHPDPLPGLEVVIIDGPAGLTTAIDTIRLSYDTALSNYGRTRRTDVEYGSSGGPDAA